MHIAIKSFEEQLFWAETKLQPLPKHRKYRNKSSYISYDYGRSSLLELIKYARDLWPLLTQGKTTNRLRKQILRHSKVKVYEAPDHTNMTVVNCQCELADTIRVCCSINKVRVSWPQCIRERPPLESKLPRKIQSSMARSQCSGTDDRLEQSGWSKGQWPEASMVNGQTTEKRWIKFWTVVVAMTRADRVTHHWTHLADTLLHSKPQTKWSNMAVRICKFVPCNSGITYWPKDLSCYHWSTRRVILFDAHHLHHNLFLDALEYTD